MNMATSSSALLSPSTLSFIFIKPKKTLHFITSHNSFTSTQSSRTLYKCYPNTFQPKTTKISATNINELFMLSETSLVDTSQEIVSNSDKAVANVISALLLFAFIGLSILTVGVVYIAVTDFLTKRDREKFEKDEAAKKKKKSGNKGKVRAGARGGPRGFGQKIEEDDDFDM